MAKKYIVDLNGMDHGNGGTSEVIFIPASFLAKRVFVRAAESVRVEEICAQCGGGIRRPTPKECCQN